MLEDVRFALRMLRKSPGFTAIAVVTMALGIGATTAIFSVLDAVLLEPLPYPAPERLVTVWETRANRPGTKGNISLPDYLDWRAASPSFEHLSALYDSSAVRTDGAEPEYLAAVIASTNVFDTLGVAPAIGRAFRAEEESFGNHRVAIIADGYWRRAFGGDPSAVGRFVTLEGTKYEIVGVLPPGFRMALLSAEPDVWTPLSYEADDLQRGAHYMKVVGRLAPGADAARAQSELDAVAARLAELYPDENAGHGAAVGSLAEEVVGDVRDPLLVLLGAVVLVLAIACANVANLQLSRSAARHREVAVRLALGASRPRLLRQFLVESVLIAAMGGALGLLLATWGVEALVALSAGGLPRTAEVGIDLRVLLFTGGLTVGTGLVFGIVPALHASDVALGDALKAGGRGATGGRNRAHAAFVVVQVALSLVLLVGSGLLLRSLYLLTTVDPGFRAEGLLTLEVALPAASYEEPARQAELAREVVARVGRLPGVEAVGAGYPLLYDDSQISLSYFRPERPPQTPAERTSAAWRPITPGYFRALGIPVLRGRDVLETDLASTQPVIVVNETLARRCFGDEDPLGRQLTIGYDDLTLEVVGVVRDIRSAGLGSEPGPEMYTAFSQTPWPGLGLFVRSAGSPEAIARQVGSSVQSIDPDLPLFGIRTMEKRLADSLAQQRFSAALIGLFAVVALALSAVGIYGVMANAVAQRTREIGVLMALGAQQRDVLRIVVGRGMALTLAGAAVGVVGAGALTRALTDMLYGVTATDPIAFTAMTVVLAAVAFVACYIPARRASRIDPAVALRSE